LVNPATFVGDSAGVKNLAPVTLLPNSEPARFFAAFFGCVARRKR
jgi:hypothetical protein